MCFHVSQFLRFSYLWQRKVNGDRKWQFIVLEFHENIAFS